MSRLLFLMMFFLIFSCQEKISSSDLQYLNGYWEIEKVEFPRGDTKEYSMNSTIDFIHFENKEGYRKKVQPRLDGTYITSDDAEAFRLIDTNGSFYLHYSNNLSKWEEQILEISADKLTVVSQENIRYYYKRYQPMAAEK
ncbi:MAG: hypothetical protein KJN76_11120 [Eudoraea sp.]|nr:hypothetical protein [Eudoraea sp.]